MLKCPYHILGSAWLLLTTSLAFMIFYVFLQATYNIVWHPLSKYPGPRHFAASPLPYVFASFRGCLATKFHELHAKYGPIVRTAPNEVSFIDPDAWSTIYGRKNKSQKPFRKNYDSFNETRSQIRHSLYLADDEEHARARKFLSHAFSPEALRAQEPLLQKHVQELMKSVENDRKRGTVDLQKWYTWIAFDIIGDTSFGEPFNCVSDPSHRAWPLMLARARKAITCISGLKNLAPSFSSFGSLPIPQKSLLQRTLLQSVVNRLNFDLDRVMSRITSKPGRGDILSDLARRIDEKSPLDEKQVMANASLFILAGTETVATLLSAVTYLLTQNPKAMASLAREIRENFQDESLLTIANLNKMTYLTACLEEALRIFPPVPEGLPRMTPPEGEAICGHWIPGGVAVQVSTLAATWSSSNFTRPLSYEPERWLDEGSICYADDNKQASQPFSTGPRNCIGQSLAMSEVRLIISNIIRRYDLECLALDSWIDQSSFLLWERKPLLVKMTPIA